MKLIVGLGNPGLEYFRNRHNVGFMVIDKITQMLNINNVKIKKNYLYFEGLYNGEKYILLKPQKYINLSGEVIKEVIDFYKIEIDNILIINDDLTMKLGGIKLKKSGSSGGHNGLKNIELNLGTNKYKRLKVGIANDRFIPTSRYVLSNFKEEELLIIDEAVKKAASIAVDFLSMSFITLMNKYNGKQGN